MSETIPFFTKKILPTMMAAALASTAQAYNVYDANGTELNVDLEAMFGVFSSDHNYDTLGTKQAGSSAWQEGYLKYGLSGSHVTGDNNSSVYGAVNIVSSGTWGDGDAAGFTIGNERETDLEDAYVGWRSGDLFPALGKDGLDLSFGRQNFAVGDGFLINGDALNFGNAFDGSMNRGGSYWLAPRKAFDETAILRIGGSEGARADVFWLKSDNVAQAKMELAGLNAEYVTPEGTYAAVYIKGLDADQGSVRDGQETMSLRYQGNAGVDNLFLSGEYVTQTQGNGGMDGDAWYLEAGWTFADVSWSPSINYRFAQFDEGFDPLFYGFNRGYGTWFQGEVAGNYAGPFNSNADVQQVALKASPTDMLSLGAVFFDFSNTSGGLMDAQELDLYAEWVVSPNLIISPLIGIYKPDNAVSTQLGDNDTNVYGQIVAIVPF
ncbi:alginate export family protein [Marinomonas fungiae]|uniref:Alginate export n=1 Tax=Marinomonas fungiae TaxID=1137284 RepID=A0A0K6IM11_9GAMM|nr:alginate export family protein [Marinomonas fungiae]CUB04128.1 Alginate export [Marinomonas fungiae]